MKLRRMKLVALAMSALMVTSALPMTAFAEEEVFFEEVADEALVGESIDEEFYIEEDFEEEEAVGETDHTSDPRQVDEQTIVFYYGDANKADYTVEYKMYNLVTKTTEDKIYTTTAVEDHTDNATCEEPAKLYLKVEIQGQTYFSKGFPKGSKLGHDWELIERDIKVKPDCEIDGEGYEYYTCRRCKENKTEDISEDLERYGHKWGAVQTTNTANQETDNVKTDKDGNVIFGSDGKAQLIDPQKDGKYYVVRYQVCERNAEHKQYLDKDGKVAASETAAKEEKVVLATKESSAKVISQEGIITNLVGLDPKDVPEEASIELKDCDKAGTYVVQYYNADNPPKPIAEKTFTVNPHHMLGELCIEFKNQRDKDQCTIVRKDGKIVDVVNHNCSRDVIYYEVYHCVAKNEKCGLKKCDAKNYLCENTNDREYSRVEKTATKSNEHIINTKIEPQIKALEGYNTDGVDYAELEKIAYGASKKTTAIEKAKETGSYIVISANTATCTEPGVATIDYICKICGAVVEQQQVKTKALGHVALPPQRNVTKEATCTEEGSYDANIYCERCGALLHEERNVAIPVVPHKYIKDSAGHEVEAVRFIGEVVVDANGALKQDFANGTTKKSVGQKAGDPGVYEDFYITTEAYKECSVCGHQETVANSKEQADIKIVGLEPSKYSCIAGTIRLEATYTTSYGEKAVKTGEFPYYVSVNAYQGRSQHDPETQADGSIKCKVCGTILKDATVTPGEEHKHTAAVAVMENIKEATCTEAGSYDLVTRCSDCGEVISSVKYITSATGHDFGAWQTSKKATVFTAGKQKRTCSHCKNVETKSIAKLPSIIKLNKTAVTVKVGKAATVKVSKWNLKDYIAPSAENGVVSANKNVATAFKNGSYTLKIRGKKAGSTTVTVKMKAGATATIKVTVKK